MAIASRETAPPQQEPSLKDRFDAVRARVTEAARRAGRAPGEVILVAVTKFAAIDEIRHLIELGHMDFGENRVQNLVQRAAQIDEHLARRRQLGPRGANPPPRIRWHMIGHMQRNKVRKVVGLVRLIHSLDSLRLAEEIQAAAARGSEPVDVLVQVNVTGAKSKSGIAPAATRHLIDQIDTMMNIRVRGLMCMGEPDDDAAAARHTFDRGRDLFEEIRRSGAAGRDFNILSMGMSHDFEAAIECGANVVRVGSAIFGRREGGSESAAPDD